MKTSERAIICRRCREEIPATGSNCPHCGASIRRRGPLVAVLLFGVVLVAASVFALSELLFFGVIGLLIVAITGYLLYDKHERLTEAEGGEATHTRNDRTV